MCWLAGRSCRVACFRNCVLCCVLASVVDFLHSCLHFFLATFFLCFSLAFLHSLFYAVPFGPSSVRLSGGFSIGTSIGRYNRWGGGGGGFRFVVRPWSPVCHSVYPQSFRNAVMTVLMANGREDTVPSVVPPALWMEVCLLLLLLLKLKK